MDKPFTNTPNLQKSVETNIPLNSRILMTFAGALFSAVSISNADFLSGVFNIVIPCFNIPFAIFGLERKYLIELSSLISMFILYMCTKSCIISQLNNYGDNKEIDEIELEDNTKRYWKDERDKYAKRALHQFNFGLATLTIPITILLPENITILGVFIIILAFVVPVSLLIREKKYKARLAQETTKSQNPVIPPTAPKR